MNEVPLFETKRLPMDRIQEMRCGRRVPPFRAGRSFGIVLAILGLLVVFGFLVASLGFFILALRLLVFVFVFVLVLFLVLVFVPSRAALLVPLPTILQRP